MKIKRPTIIIIVSVVLAILTLLSIYSSLLTIFGGCNYVIRSGVNILDGRYVATVYTCNCGATTRISVHVSIRPASKQFKPEDAEDIFIADGVETVALAWTNQNRLIILIPKGARIFREEPFWNTVRIKYNYE
jgi:Family of unknown function (DUF5412)